VIFPALLRRVLLPRYPTGEVLLLRQQAPLLHLTRWMQYQFPAPSLGVKKLLEEAQTLQAGITLLSGLMAEEIALIRLQDNHADGVDHDLIQKNQDDQYEQILELGRHELTFNSLQQNLKC